MPLLHKIVDPEKAHELAIKMAKRGWMTSSESTMKEYPELECNVLGRNFKNPIGEIELQLCLEHKLKL